MKILITGINGFVVPNFTDSWFRSHTDVWVGYPSVGQKGMRKTLESFR